MYSLSYRRRRVDALMRKLAKPIAIMKMRRAAEEICEQWAEAVADREPVPETPILIQKVARAGFKLPNFMRLDRYLERCRNGNKLPQVYDFIRAIFPWSVNYGLYDSLRWDRAA